MVGAWSLGSPLTRELRFLLLVPAVGGISSGGLFPFLLGCGFSCVRFVGLHGFWVLEKEDGLGHFLLTCALLVLWSGAL